MKAGSKDEVAGKIHEVTGAIKETVGKLTNNPDVEGEGKVEGWPAEFRRRSAR
jgi:uncharacterized protein YjbJ (UPF0337 family)